MSGILQLTPEAQATGGSWWEVRGAYVELDGSVAIANVSGEAVDIVHIDVGGPGTMAESPGARARFAPNEIAPGKSARLVFKVTASPVFRREGPWLFVDIVLRDSVARRHLLREVRFRQVTGC